MNNRGKDICKELKAVRKRIAEENGIDLEIPECTYHGPCKGTCPRCESEVRFLENALAQKIRMGKVATVAGLALTLGVTGSAAAQSTTTAPVDTTCIHQNMRLVRVEGVVMDSLTKEVSPFVNVIVLKNKRQVNVATTDLDGNFQLYLEEGEYEFLISTVGYALKRFPVKVPGDMPLKAIELEGTSVEMMGMVDYKVPVIDIGAPGVTSGAEIDGVQLRIQY